MKTAITIIFGLLALFFSNICLTQNKLPYPIIFIHGLAGSDGTFGDSMEYLRDHNNLGEINVFDICLNADNEDETSLMSEDVKWENFVHNDEEIFLGRRNYTGDEEDYVHEWTESNIFAVNFKEEKFEGANGFFNDYFDQSNQAAIYKQGYALNKMIQEVLDFTGAEKVILVGHSMGGLCIREYLQRTNENNMHINWIDPTTPDGHKVARVATFGTPHLGSTVSPDPTKSDIPDEQGKSEANRDMLWEYDSYNFCDGYEQGIYLFGGNEHCIESEEGILGNKTFANVDINCNGSQNDDIIGINKAYDSQEYNPDMPLPLNIKYTYMTSIWIGWDIGLIGDGAVDINRQWLYDEDRIPVPYNITDTLLSDVFHTSEGNDYLTLIRGLDEPKQFSLAYGLNLNHEIIGYVTYQQNRIELDEDVFKLKCGENSMIGFVYNDQYSNIHTIEFYDLNENLILSKDVTDIIDTTFVNIPANDSEIYVKLIGNATPTSWENPYQISAYPIVPTSVLKMSKLSANIYPNPTSGNCTIKLSDNKPCSIKIYNANSTEVFYSEMKQSNVFNFDFLSNGIYTVKIDSKSSSISKKLVILK